MSAENIENTGLNAGFASDREQVVAHVAADGRLAAAALRYAKRYASGDAGAQARYAEWLSHPESWDDFGVAAA